MHPPLHDYQIRAIKFALEKKNTFMMVDMGLGKTAIALKAIQKIKNPTLVLAPLRPCYATWPAEILKWTPTQSFTILHGSKKGQRLKLDRDIYILNYDGIKWFYNALITGQARFKMKLNLILDESSFVKNPSTLRFKTLKKLKPLWSGFSMDLSATPTPNGLHEIWSQYYMLDSGERLGTNYNVFANQFFNRTGPPMYKTTIRRGAESQIHDRIRDITFRLDAKDYLKMPPITYNDIELGLTPKLQKEYEALENDFFLDLGNSEVEVFNAGALSSKLRQFIQGCVYTNKSGAYEKIHNLKIDALKELRESTTQPILCPIQFKFELKQIEAQIKGVPCISGKTNAREAYVYINEWNKGNLPLLLCHPASLGHGVNLQTGGHIILWFGLPWSLEQYQQTIGRLHRQGQQNHVMVHHFIMKKTLDVDVARALRAKGMTQKKFLDALKERRFR